MQTYSTAATAPVSTPRTDRKPVPSKLVLHKVNQKSVEIKSAPISIFNKIYYPEVVSSVEVSTASMKYRALRFGLDNLPDDGKIAETQRFALFYNGLAVSITELFDHQAVKFKYDAAGLAAFTSLQGQFLAAGTNSEIQLELVKRAYKKKGSPTRERVVRSIYREKVSRDAAEYERISAENKAIEEADFDAQMQTDAADAVQPLPPLPSLDLQEKHLEKVALEKILQQQRDAEKKRTDAAARAAAQSLLISQSITGQPPQQPQQLQPQQHQQQPPQEPRQVVEDLISEPSDSESDSSENSPWMVAGSYKQKFLTKQTAVAASETSQIFEISLLHNTSEMKWATLMNLVKSVFKKIGVDCAIVGTKDHFLTNTKSRSVVKVISIRLGIDEDTSQLLKNIQDAAPALNIDTPGAVLKAANAAEYSWRGLSAILGDSYGVTEIQQLLDSAAPTRFRITDFTVEATTDELTHLNIQRDTCKTKILDNEGELEDVDEFIFVKAVTLHGIETTASAKALNLYTVKKRGHNQRNILKHSLGTKRVRCKKCGGRNHLAKDCEISDAEIRATSEIKRAKKARRAVSAFFK